MAKNEIQKLERAIYFDNVMQNEMDALALSEEITPEGYEQKCTALIEQKLYVENKAIDVINYMKQLEMREDFLKKKKQAINDQQNNIKAEIERADNLLTKFVGDKKLTIEEYELSNRQSERLVIDNITYIPDDFKQVNVDMSYNDYMALYDHPTVRMFNRVINIRKDDLKKWLKEDDPETNRKNTCEGAHIEKCDNLQIKG